MISTHAPLAGRDRLECSTPISSINFNPRAPCGARPRRDLPTTVTFIISTHAPLAGRDSPHSLSLLYRYDFNPRAPCGARPIRVQHAYLINKFQPTRPLRGATFLFLLWLLLILFQPTRPLRGATARAANRSPIGNISTHAPLAGRDSKSVQITMHIFAITDKFQMLLHRMPPVRAFCSFLMQENHADFGCEPPK